MFIFGHLGVTLGAATLINGLVTRNARPVAASPAHSAGGNAISEAGGPKRSSPASWFGSLGKTLDLRFLLVGSLMPDIIDKPIGIFLYGNGRIIYHTLLVSLLVLVFGLFLRRRYRWNGLLAIAVGMLTHLVLDQMWLNPQTLFWPLFGWAFPPSPVSDWLGVWMNDLLHEASVYIPELIGFAIVVWFAVLVVRQKKVTAFLKKGYF
jgi:inner membrane protein